MKENIVKCGFLFSEMIDEPLFEVTTPINLKVSVGKRRWSLITTEKHPSLLGRENEIMEQVKVVHDKQGNTLTVWFSNPKDEYVSEETGEEVILMKNKEGRVIGFEKLNLIPSNLGQVKIDFETITV